MDAEDQWRVEVASKRVTVVIRDAALVLDHDVAHATGIDYESPPPSTMATGVLRPRRIPSVTEPESNRWHINGVATRLSGNLKINVFRMDGLEILMPSQSYGAFSALRTTSLTLWQRIFTMPGSARRHCRTVMDGEDACRNMAPPVSAQLQCPPCEYAFDDPPFLLLHDRHHASRMSDSLLFLHTTYDPYVWVACGILHQDLRPGPGEFFLGPNPSSATLPTHAAFSPDASEQRQIVTHPLATLHSALRLHYSTHSREEWPADDASQMPRHQAANPDAPRFSPQEIVDAAETPPNGSLYADSNTLSTQHLHPRPTPFPSTRVPPFLCPPPILPGCTSSAPPASTHHSSFLYPFCSSASCSVSVSDGWWIDKEAAVVEGVLQHEIVQLEGENSLWDPSSDDDNCWTTIFIIFRHSLSRSP
ncbi:hypothetical protein C8F01DRAFT_1342899 [Mycena amicta]|nr:hypothetical protein C8F01DRAFT_1342899 [Mycena amicta]